MAVELELPVQLNGALSVPTSGCSSISATRYWMKARIPSCLGGVSRTYTVCTDVGGVTPRVQCMPRAKCDRISRRASLGKDTQSSRRATVWQTSIRLVDHGLDVPASCASKRMDQTKRHSRCGVRSSHTRTPSPPRPCIPPEPTPPTRPRHPSHARTHARTHARKLAGSSTKSTNIDGPARLSASSPSPTEPNASAVPFSATTAKFENKSCPNSTSTTPHVEVTKQRRATVGPHSPQSYGRARTARHGHGRSRGRLGDHPETSGEMSGVCKRSCIPLYAHELYSIGSPAAGSVAMA